MTDLQEMSDYLAEHLLGWHIEDGVWANEDATKFAVGGLFFQEHVEGGKSWHPHTDIAQCFEYIVPAMTKIGWQLSLDVGEISSSAMWWRPAYLAAPHKIQADPS